jgi:hypothetical protein
MAQARSDVGKVLRNAMVESTMVFHCAPNPRSAYCCNRLKRGLAEEDVESNTSIESTREQMVQTEDWRNSEDGGAWRLLF